MVTAGVVQEHGHWDVVDEMTSCFPGSASGEMVGCKSHKATCVLLPVV